MTTAQLATAIPGGNTVRAMRPDDLDAVAALDARIGGRMRRGYFVRRLESALAAPERHVQLAAEGDNGTLAGFIFYLIEAGEFGAGERIAALETIGVLPELRRRRVGAALIERARAIMRRKGIASETTRADWRNHGLLAFIDGAGFKLAPRHVISFDLANAHAVLESEAEAAALAAAGLQAEPQEIDYGGPQFESDPPARGSIPVRSMNADDFAAVMRIDRLTFARDRHDYIRSKMTEALQRSGVRVSLVAEIDRTPVGFVMAKMEFGEFGRTEPVAVLDTIGVDPKFRRAGVASALLTQLVGNLRGLAIDHLETEAARDQFDMLGFFYRRGFAPSQRLAFSRPLT